MSVVLGVDIGGSHITAAAVDLERRLLVEGVVRRRAVDAQASAESITGAWCAVLRELLEDGTAGSRKIGIAMPGPFDYEQGISLIHEQEKFRALYGMNLKQALARQLQVLPENIRMINDAAAFLQGEVFGGAAQGFSRVLGLTLGTGLGSAVYRQGTAEDAGLWQTPFRGGIAEDYLSTRWFVRRNLELGGPRIGGVKDLLEAGCGQVVEQLFAELRTNLAQFLLPLIGQYHPEAVVFGGNISRAHTLFLPALQKELTDKVHQVVLKAAALGETAALIGAASCWLPQDRSWSRVNH